MFVDLSILHILQSFEPVKVMTGSLGAPNATLFILFIAGLMEEPARPRGN
ncbi:hypothetical protein RR42_m1576 [Cupriavidus basilensis]|uniref:Uncharacterized protein n=1 Tax=Cupriavidus basilensis TaxID=68895 RepID=A0A0C4Y9M4_9BURK|nr:hypothetical protein RR42_m1576 [Cupriavidus basilensis]